MATNPKIQNIYEKNKEDFFVRFWKENILVIHIPTVLHFIHLAEKNGNLQFLLSFS